MPEKVQQRLLFRQQSHLVEHSFNVPADVSGIFPYWNRTPKPDAPRFGSDNSNLLRFWFLKVKEQLSTTQFFLFI